jgi:hypothetical protein
MRKASTPIRRGHSKISVCRGSVAKLAPRSNAEAAARAIAATEALPHPGSPTGRR